MSAKQKQLNSRPNLLVGHKALTFDHLIRLRVRIRRILQPGSRITHAAYGQSSKSPAHGPYFSCRDAR